MWVPAAARVRGGDPGREARRRYYYYYYYYSLLLLLLLQLLLLLLLLLLIVLKKPPGATSDMRTDSVLVLELAAIDAQAPSRRPQGGDSIVCK